MKHFKRERHGNAYLFKLTRTGQTIAGVSEKGHTLTFPGYTDDLTNDELLELLRESSITAKSITDANRNWRSKPFYTSISDGTGMLLIRLLPDKHEGYQLAEVELKSPHPFKGDYGDVVYWQWQDMRPIIVPADWVINP